MRIGRWVLMMVLGWGALFSPRALAAMGPIDPAAATLAEELARRETFRTNVLTSFASRRFVQLDALASQLRDSRARFVGGLDKLALLYHVLGEPPRGEKTTEEDWQQRVQGARDWVVAAPESLTARIVSARILIGYAWAARGTGWSSEVTPEGRRHFKERLDAAEVVLRQTRELPGRCRGWYVAWLVVCRAKSGARAEFMKMVDEALTLEPLNFNVFLEGVTYLLPRWHGEPGAWESFVADMVYNVGGDEGQTIYSEVFSKFATSLGQEIFAGLPWAKLKTSFEVRRRLFGRSWIDLNYYCLAAYLYRDNATAAKLFTELGEEYYEVAWDNRDAYEAARFHANRPPPAHRVPLTPVRDPPSMHPPVVILPAEVLQQLGPPVPLPPPAATPEEK